MPHDDQNLSAIRHAASGLSNDLMDARRRADLAATLKGWNRRNKPSRDLRDLRRPFRDLNPTTAGDALRLKLIRTEIRNIHDGILAFVHENILHVALLATERGTPELLDVAATAEATADAVDEWRKSEDWDPARASLDVAVPIMRVHVALHGMRPDPASGLGPDDIREMTSLTANCYNQFNRLV